MINPTSISPDLWSAIRRSYDAQTWSNVILDAVYFLSDVIREKSGLQSDGTALAGQAFGGKDPKLKLNRLITETDLNIQAGVEQIVRGIYQAVRNPRSHERLQDDQQDADAIVIFINYLLGVIGHAKSVFSLESFVERINDENFVSNERYAELLLSEVPKTKRLDALMAAFESADMKSAARYKNLFQVMIESLSERDLEQFYEALTRHLRDSNHDFELRAIFQLLKPEQWLRLGEVERMRSENRVIRSMATGKYSTRTNQCESGALATWAKPFFSKFSLKNEVLHEAYAAITSNSRERQDYILQFFFSSFDSLAETPPIYFVRHIARQLGRGDVRYKIALEQAEIFISDSWIDPFREAMLQFVQKENVAPSYTEVEDDDIPF